MTSMPNAPLDAERDLWFLGTFMRVHLRGAETQGRMTVVEQTAPAGFSPPRHVHEVEDTVMFVLEGQLTVAIGDTQRVARAGEAVFLPRGIPHTFRADVETRLLEIGTPGGFDQFYAENAMPAPALALPAGGPPSLEQIDRLGRSSAEHRAEFVGPPLAPAE